MMNRIVAVQVSDTTKLHSNCIAGKKNIYGLNQKVQKVNEG